MALVTPKIITRRDWLWCYTHNVNAYDKKCCYISLINIRYVPHMNGVIHALSIIQRRDEFPKYQK